MITQEASGSGVAQDRMCEFYRAMTHALMREAVDEQIGEGGEQNEEEHQSVCAPEAEGRSAAGGFQAD